MMQFCNRTLAAARSAGHVRHEQKRTNPECRLKLPPLEYASPTSIEDAIQLLAAHNGEAKVISGGQSLMPMLAFRLAAPKLLVDLRHVPGLAAVTIDDRGIQLGAKLTWRDLEYSERLAIAHPMLRLAVGLASPEGLSALQAAFRKHHDLQCGFCTPGILVTMHALLCEKPDADDGRIREVLLGNLCRCTGYIPIVEAVLEARAAYRAGASLT
jgi:xanthine dehydrogenase iron-sulfur cluster and FAD-binding subunit A